MLALLALPAAAAAAPIGFVPREIPVAGRDLFDLGVADVDDDADLDVFTTNHLSRQSLLVNDGAGRFSERVYEAGLAHTRAFPGWEEPAPAARAPGLHLSHAGSALHLRTVGPGTARGTVAFLLPTRAGASDGAGAVVRHDTRPGPDAYVAHFRLGPDSRVRLDPRRMAHPFRVHIEAPFPLSDVHVGASPRAPADRRFTLALRDRHGMAWADVAGNAATDVYMVRGGLRGEIDELAGAIEDELLAGGAGAFSPAGRSATPRKGACRGRQAGAVDFTEDGQLDLWASCKGWGTRLYRRTAAGFVRDGRLGAERVRWLDLDGDVELEVLGVYPRGFAVFDDKAGSLRRVHSVSGRHGPVKDTGFATADYDGDGDQDAYVSSPAGSTLLRNARGRLRAVSPARAGLPGSTLAAAWCDYDNDGLQDLMVVPGGIFRQAARGEFVRAGALAPIERPREARLACADLDGNGARDVLVTARSKETRRDWRTLAYTGAGLAGRWLYVDLAGRAGNRQAIGARVTVRAGGRPQVQWVGQNDTSLYSQGHYRVYFGLGAAGHADVTVRWPDGHVQRLTGVATNRLMRIER